jgi:putative peptidoglycan lipid II flippase
MILQFALLTVIAKIFGTSAAVDAFNAAFSLPIAISAILSAPLPLVLVPEMVRAFESGAPGRAWRLAGVLLVIVVTVAILIATIVQVASSAIAGLLFAGLEESTLQLATDYLRRLIWLVPLNCAITLLQAMHHARHRFRVAASSGIIGVSVPLIWAIWLRQPTLLQIVDATVLGGLLAVVVLAVPILKSMVTAWKATGGVGTGLRRFAMLVAPLLVVGVYSRIDPLVDRSIASHLSPGSIAQLGYAQRLITALATLITSGLSITTFPQFARFADAKPADGNVSASQNNLLTSAIQYLLILLIPCLFAIFIYGDAIVADLFQRGEFGAEATRSVALLLCGFTGMLFAGSIGEIATKSLFARGATRAPAVIAVVGFTLGIGLKISLADRFGVLGVAFGTSLYFMLNVIALLALIHRRDGRNPFAGTGATVLRSLIASLAAVAVAWLPVHHLQWGGALVGGAAGAIVYGLLFAVLTLRPASPSR